MRISSKILSKEFWKKIPSKDVPEEKDKICRFTTPLNPREFPEKSSKTYHPNTPNLCQL